jgi:hypothetical protein
MEFDWLLPWQENQVISGAEMVGYRMHEKPSSNIQFAKPDPVMFNLPSLTP